MHTISRRSHVLAALLTTSMLIASCGSDDDPGAESTNASAPTVTSLTTDSTVTESSAATEPTDPEPETTDSVTAQPATLDELFSGTYTEPSATSSTPPSELDVWVLTCGQAAVGCAQIGAGLEAAGSELGWSVTVYDGKLGADNAFATGVRQATAAGADVIVLAAIDCSSVVQPLAEAKEAGVTVIGVGAYDCDDPRVGSPAMFDGSVVPSDEFPTAVAYNRANGAVKAQWLIDKQGEGTTALSMFQVDSLIGTDYHEGFVDGMAACSSCTVIPVPFTFADFGPGLSEKAAAALAEHPEATALNVPFDSVLLLGVAQTVERADLPDDFAVLGNEGYTPNLQLIRDGAGQSLATGISAQLSGWAAADSIIRVLAGEQPASAGAGFRLIDIDHMVPDDGVAAEVPVDFRSAYLQAWGVAP